MVASFRIPTRRLPTASWTADVLASTPAVTILELGIASNVLCFPSDSKYGPASLPHGHILAIHFNGTLNKMMKALSSHYITNIM